jgi:glyoxylase-like metal-dependent hydrolase (beta-lactamase superfamily II)/ketosteroid isomerase-like protein
MASASEIAKRYFAALDARDIDAALALWSPDGVDRLVGQQELAVPDGIREYFTMLFAASPDFRLEVLETTAYRNRCAVRWRARGTFAGPGRLQGNVPNGAKIDLEGCDVLTVADDLIQRNDAYFDSAGLARQLGLLPPIGSKAEARLTALANVRTHVGSRIHASEPESIADGVWVIRGGFPVKTFNVYLIEDDGGVTVFDGGIRQMQSAVAAAGARLGGIKRIVLGHADADHRGIAPGLGAPVYCHPDDRAAAESDAPYRDYWDKSKLGPHGRAIIWRLLPTWDGGAVEVAGTVDDGDTIADFRVVHLPGHAPGLIVLFRESDRLALVTDCFYTFDPQTGIKGPARVAHETFNADTDQARESMRKLASLEPLAAWPGHADPLTGDVGSELIRATSA